MSSPVLRRTLLALVAAVVIIGLLGFGMLVRVIIFAALVLAACVAPPVIRFRGWRRVVGGFGGFLAFLAIVALAIRLRFGGGDTYPDLTTAPSVPASALVPLATLDFPPGNVAVGADGRIFFNYHPFAKAGRLSPSTMFELVGGEVRPYPDAAFQKRYQGVFGMTVDRQQRLWLIEPASLDHARTRLLAFDLRSNALVVEHWFAKGDARFAQDLRVAPDGQTVYLADTGFLKFTPGSVYVFDVATKTSRQVLASAAALQPQDWVITTPFGPLKLAFGLVTFAVGIDGLELSADGAWLFFGGMCHDRIFKVPTAALRDPALSAEAVERTLVEVGKKPLSDGLTVDRDGSVLITDIEHGGLARLDEHGLTTLVRSPSIIWADGVVVAPDGAILFTDSAIPAYLDRLGLPPAEEDLVAHRPYRLYRIAPR